MSNNIDLKQTILEIEEIKLKAQLKAIRDCRRAQTKEQTQNPDRSMSQIEYVYIILKTAIEPLHITDIIKIAQESYEIELNRESIVSALTKKVLNHDRFIRVGKNTFGLAELYKP